MNKGGRNLVILGIGAAVIALATTSVSLIIYHNSGDIYLDRSRPGYLPEKDETEEDQKQDYVFSEDGTINGEVIDEFTEEFQKVIDSIDKLEDPFSSKPISDENLGIPADLPIPTEGE